MHLAIKEHQIASEYLEIHDRQIAIAHLTMKVRQIAIAFLSKREYQMTSNYLAMFLMFAHLAIEERQIASIIFRGRERQMTTAIRYVCLTKQIIQKENILFMFYHIHETLKFMENGYVITFAECLGGLSIDDGPVNIACYNAC
jgi:hypothetical protein